MITDTKYVLHNYRSLYLLDELEVLLKNNDFWKIDFSEEQVYLKRYLNNQHEEDIIYLRSNDNSEYYEIIPDLKDLFLELFFIYKTIKSNKYLINDQEKLEDYLLKNKIDYEVLLRENQGI